MANPVEIWIGERPLTGNQKLMELSSSVFFCKEFFPVVDYSDAGFDKKSFGKWVKEAVDRKFPMAFVVPGEQIFVSLGKVLGACVRKVKGAEWESEDGNLMDHLAFVMNYKNREELRGYLVEVKCSTFMIIKFLVSNMDRLNKHNKKVVEYLSKLLFKIQDNTLIDLLCYHIQPQPEMNWFKYRFKKAVVK